VNAVRRQSTHDTMEVNGDAAMVPEWVEEEQWHHGVIITILSVRPSIHRSVRHLPPLQPALRCSLQLELAA
jgi:hypothetical protein